MKNYWKLLVGLMTTFLLVGCQQKATVEQIAEVQSKIDGCYARAVEYQKAYMSSISFEDEKLAIIYGMFMQQNQGKAFESCDDMAIAVLNYHERRFGKIADGTFRLGGIGLGLVGVDMIVDGIVDLANPGNGPSEIWNVSGSRVVNRSTATEGSTISSSGTGLGLGNTFNTGDGQGIGGIDPRTTNANGPVTDLTTGSNSGDNASIQPVEGQDPTILPVE